MNGSKVVGKAACGVAGMVNGSKAANGPPPSCPWWHTTRMVIKAGVRATNGAAAGQGRHRRQVGAWWGTSSSSCPLLLNWQ